MSLSKAKCPKCGAEILVNASEDATICQLCGKPFITAKAIEAFLASSEECGPYQVTIVREKNTVISNDTTFIMIINGRPRPLSDDSWITVTVEEKCFEIPVFITDNEKTSFEGVLTGIGDGKDIRITWNADKVNLGKITSTTNDTVHFLERKGAADW